MTDGLSETLASSHFFQPITDLNSHLNTLAAKISSLVVNRMDITEQSRKESEKRAALTTVYSGLSNQNLLHQQSVELIEKRALFNGERADRLEQRKQKMRKLQQEMSKQKEKFLLEKELLNKNISEMESFSKELIAGVEVKILNEKFSKDLDELDAQILQNEAEAKQLQQDLDHDKRLHNSMVQKMRRHFESDVELTRAKHAKSLESEMAMIEKLDRRGKAEVDVLRKVHQVEISKIEKLLNNLQDERNKLREAFNQLPNSEICRKRKLLAQKDEHQFKSPSFSPDHRFHSDQVKPLTKKMRDDRMVAYVRELLENES